MASEIQGLTPENYKGSIDSVMYSSTGQAIGDVAPPGVLIDDSWRQISPNMIHAIISVEDKRYWTDPGVDVKGVVRAFLSDATGGEREGGSTIAEEFVKVREEQEDHRTVFEKLHEALLAFQLVHHWKRITILTDYLNTIYFGHGANGIEAAARIYFGSDYGFNPEATGVEPPTACGDADAQDPERPSCASKLTPAQAALLAGMVANPSAFDPILHPQAALGRRALVLRDMRAQGYITQAQYQIAIGTPLPTSADIETPQEPEAAPYFTSWVTPLIIHAMEQEGLSKNEAQYEAYYGGLKIHLTLNEEMQQAAQQAVNTYFPAGSNGPTAALVAIDNQNGEVRAMVSGNGDYEQDPFNLATYGNRQPGSSFKLFTLALALEHGYTPETTVVSKPLNILYQTSAGPEHFIVHNFGNVYAGPISFQAALDTSDNSVFTQVGLKMGPNNVAATNNIAAMAHAMGIRSPISTNPAMIIGGLTTGVTTLDMAHAYSTVANGGLKVYNPVLGDYDQGAIGIQSITGCVPCHQPSPITNAHPSLRRVIPASIAAEMQEMLEGVVSPGGTGYSAAIPGVVVAGKTGTTTNYVDAWFVGWTPQLTTAVWVGFPNRGIQMDTQYDGKPVEGGTFPALIWREFETAALEILANEAVQETGTSTIGTGTSTLPGTAQTYTTGIGTGATTNTVGASTLTTGNTSTTGIPTGSSTTPSGTTTSGGGGL